MDADDVVWNELVLEALAIYDAAVALFERYDAVNVDHVGADDVNDDRGALRGVMALVDEMIRFHIPASRLQVLSPLRLRHLRDEAEAFAQDY
jgi:hypothetical protein